MNTDSLLSVRSLSLSKGRLRFVDNVSFEIKRGEIVGLCGENGAGKTAFVSMLTGAAEPTAGSIFFEGREYKKLDQGQALKLGICAVTQDFSLIPNLSVAENIFYGHEPKSFGIISRKKMHAQAETLLESFELRLDVRKRICDISETSRQIVQILKAVSFNPKLLILDEPTALFSERETALLFKLLRALSEKQTAVIFISSRLDELLELCDRVTVFKDGETVADRRTSDLTVSTLTNLIVLRELHADYKVAPRTSDKTVLECQNLESRQLHNVSLKLYEGEILGIMGRVGSGCTELGRVLYGLTSLKKGQITLQGKRYRPHDPRYALRKGLGYVPEDRLSDGIVPELSVRENLLFTCGRKFFKVGFFTSLRKERRAALKLMDELKVRTLSLEYQAGRLTSSSQLKVVLGRVVSKGCKVLIIDEPTRAIDVGARQEIHSILNMLSSRGISIILLSSQPSDLMAVTQRMYVMAGGTVTAEFERADYALEKITGKAQAVRLDELAPAKHVREKESRAAKKARIKQKKALRAEKPGTAQNAADLNAAVPDNSAAAVAAGTAAVAGTVAATDLTARQKFKELLAEQNSPTRVSAAAFSGSQEISVELGPDGLSEQEFDPAILNQEQGEDAPVLVKDASLDEVLEVVEQAQTDAGAVPPDVPPLPDDMELIDPAMTPTGTPEIFFNHAQADLPPEFDSAEFEKQVEAQGGFESQIMPGTAPQKGPKPVSAQPKADPVSVPQPPQIAPKSVPESASASAVAPAPKPAVKAQAAAAKPAQPAPNQVTPAQAKPAQASAAPQKTAAPAQAAPAVKTAQVRPAAPGTQAAGAVRPQAPKTLSQRPRTAASGQRAAAPGAVRPASAAQPGKAPAPGQAVRQVRPAAPGARPAAAQAVRQTPAAAGQAVRTAAAATGQAVRTAAAAAGTAAASGTMPQRAKTLTSRPLRARPAAPRSAAAPAQAPVSPNAPADGVNAVPPQKSTAKAPVPPQAPAADPAAQSADQAQSGV